MLKRLIPPAAAVAIVALTAGIGLAHSQIPVDNTPIRPAIPQADRSNLSKVFLEHADRLVTSSNVDYQILSGNVEFRRGGMLMYCDSAHFYDKTGDFDAFGNVKMRQGDTLFIDGDRLEYNDSAQLAVLYGDFGRDATLRNRDVTLTTAIFNYDMRAEIGFYDVGGVLTDRQNRLSSVEGEYSPATKEATFLVNVVLTSLSEKDTLTIHTNNLYYNTATHVAELTTYSTVQNGDGTIVTTNGIYNTETTQADLFENSLVTARNGNTLSGDTIYYNRNAGRGEVFGNMELNDTTNKMILSGDYGFYNELTDSAFVTGRARVVEYSAKDSLFLHADSIRAFRIISLKKIAKQDSLPTATVLENDSIAQPINPEPDSIDSETFSVPARVLYTTVPDTVRYVVASPRVKFYRRDIQGLCDSMTFVSADTMLHMDHFPIVWSDNRQIRGDVINIHLNDSTLEWARVPSNGFMAEMIEPDYFNQLSGKEMYATFKDGAISALDVSGNVLAIFFPEENDSTINKMVNLESSFMAVKFKENAIEKMRLWPETNAVATPLYLAKRSAMYLPGFRWYGYFRPSGPDDIFNFPDELIEEFRNAPVYIPPQLPQAPAAPAVRDLTTIVTEEQTSGSESAAESAPNSDVTTEN